MVALAGVHRGNTDDAYAVGMHGAAGHAGGVLCALGQRGE